VKGKTLLPFHPQKVRERGSEKEKEGGKETDGLWHTQAAPAVPSPVPLCHNE